MNYNNQKKKRIGFTCSSFDLCHAGHMMMLKEAKTQCDHLIVGLQSDPTLDNDKNVSYRGKLKNKPIMSLAERKEILEGIKYVDELFIYTDEADLYEKIKNLKYDVRILGADWKGKKYTGWDLPHEAYFNERNHSYSTSELRQRVYIAEKERLESTEAQPEVVPSPGFFKRLGYFFQRLVSQKQKQTAYN